MSLRTRHRRARGRPLAAARLVAKGDLVRDHVSPSCTRPSPSYPDGAVVLAEDETHLNLLPWVRHLDHPRRLPAGADPGTNRRRSIFGAVDAASGRVFYHVARKAISGSFTAFCEQLLAACPAAPVVAVVCDNVAIHHSKLVDRRLADHPRLRVLHGARYSHTTTRSSGCGRAQGVAGQQPDVDIQGRIRQVHAFFRGRRPTNFWPPPRHTAHPAELQAGRLVLCSLNSIGEDSSPVAW